MTEFIANNKEILSFCVSALAILLTLAFGGILSWRHRICLDYESRRDVAINILRDRFVQRTSSHYTHIADELGRQERAVEELYARPEQVQLIRELGRDLEDQNRVRRLFRWLVIASQASFGLVWAAVVVIIIAVAALWANPPFIVFVLWAIALGALLIGFFVFVTMMWVFDGKFFQLVHRIIEPEGE